MNNLIHRSFDILVCISLLISSLDWRVVILYWLLRLVGRKFLSSLRTGFGLTEYSVYKVVYGVFMLHMCITHSVNIANPFEDYYFHNDQLVFYSDAKRISAFELKDIINASLFNLRYSEYPLFSLIIGLIYKASSAVGIVDKLLVLKMVIVVLAAQIPAIIGAILTINQDKYRMRTLMYFSIFGYILVQSAVFSRDLPVAFFYSFLAFLLVVPRCKMRLFKMVVLCLVIAGFRIEHGIYSLALPLLFLWRNSNSVNKMLYSILALSLFVYFDVINAALDIFLEASTVFHNHTASSSTHTNSLYLRFASLPFPSNILFGIIYTSVMPFPLFSWVFEDLTMMLSVISPFYWVFVLFLSSYMFFSKRNKTDILSILFVFSIIFIALSSYIEPTVRRNFAVYPLIFAYFMSANLIVKKSIKVILFLMSTTIVLIINVFAYVYLYVF